MEEHPPTRRSTIVKLSGSWSAIGSAIVASCGSASAADANERADSASEPRLGVGPLHDRARFCMPAIVDDVTRECLALLAETSLPGLRGLRAWT
jgi:hypothetical protein